jgi:hypothetical protein
MCKKKLEIAVFLFAFRPKNVIFFMFALSCSSLFYHEIWLATSQPSITPKRSSKIPQQKPMTDYLGHFGRSLLNSKEPLSERKIMHPQNVAETWLLHRLDGTQKQILADSFVASLAFALSI